MITVKGIPLERISFFSIEEHQEVSEENQTGLPSSLLLNYSEEAEICNVYLPPSSKKFFQPSICHIPPSKKPLHIE